MRICYLASSVIPSRTANSVHVMKMCQAYARLGHEVQLIVPDRPTLYEPNITDLHSFYDVEDSFEIVRLRPRRPLKLWYSTVFAKAAKNFRPCFVHTRNEWAAWGLTRLWRQPVVLEIHESPFTASLQSYAMRSIASSRSLLAMVSITSALRDHLVEHLGSKVKHCVEPDAVDEAWLNPTSEPSEVNRRPTITYVGSLYQGRGIELIVELARQLTEYSFVVVGGREHQVADWRSQVADLKNIDFVGFVQQNVVASYMRSADVLLMPHSSAVLSSGGRDISEYCSPMKMFEYMASGKPMVASKLPVLQEVLRDEENAVLVDIDSIEAWKVAIRKLVDNPLWAKQIASNAIRDVTRFTWRNRAERIVAAVQDSKVFLSRGKQS